MSKSSYLTLGTHFVGCTTLSSHSLLSSLPRGAYTTARSTKHGKGVLELPFHIHRTAGSVQSMQALESPAQSSIMDGATLGPVMKDGLASVLGGASALEGKPNLEYKLTCLYLWGRDRISASLDTLLPTLATPPSPSEMSAFAQRDSLMITHATPLQPPHPPPILCVCRGGPRVNAGAKDSEWVRARLALEAEMKAGEEEALLMDDQGGICEGTQTNFFAVTRDGRLITAGGGACLEGTIRKIVLEVASKEGIPVDLKAPSVSEAEGWGGMFLTSTSRLLLPVDVIEWGGGKRVQLPSAANPTVMTLKRGVEKWVEEASDMVL